MFRSLFKDQSGVAAVEFALIAPVLIFLAIGIFDYGMFINKQMLLENTARSAAEYLNQGGDEDFLQDDIISLINFNVPEETLDSMALTTLFTCECTGGSVVDCDDGTCTENDEDTDTYMRRYVDVSLTMTFQTILPYPGLADEMELTGSTRLQVN